MNKLSQMEAALNEKSTLLSQVQEQLANLQKDCTAKDTMIDQLKNSSTDTEAKIQ